MTKMEERVCHAAAGAIFSFDGIFLQKKDMLIPHNLDAATFHSLLWPMKRPISERLPEIFTFLKKDPDLAQELLALGVVQSLPDGTPLYWNGDECGQIAFVCAGEIRVFKEHPGGREITLYEITGGEICILNASCILGNTRYPANAATVSHVEVLILSAGVFRRLLHSHQAMQSFVFSQISSRLTSVMTLLEEVAFNRMDERLEEYLIEKAENNRLTTTHQTIANDMGTSREVVSRLLKEMERGNKVVLARNSITLIAP